MAVYSTFFLCKPVDLSSFSDGSSSSQSLPLDDIGDASTAGGEALDDQALEWLTEVSAPAPRNRHVPSGEATYQDYLEGRLSPFVYDRPHWAAKRLTDIELEPLLGALGLKPVLEPAEVALSNSEAVMLQLPIDMPSKLAAMDQRALEALAARWAAAMSAPEYTHSVDGRRLSDGWTPAQAMEYLVPIHALARQATPQDRMYLLVET